MNYDEIRAEMHGRDHRKLYNNTYARMDGADVVLKLHATDIMRWSPDGALTYDTGGWYSVTTKERMNRYGRPFTVHAERGTWYIGAHLGDGVHATPAPFYDGVTVNTHDVRGSLERVHGSPETMRAAELLAADKVTKRRISAYVRALTTDVVDGWFANGSTAGDCLFCQIAWSNPDTDSFGGTEHLESHVDPAERYLMPTLTLTALRECGYNAEVILQIRAVDIMRRALRRYLESRLLVGASSGRKRSATFSGGY